MMHESAAPRFKPYTRTSIRNAPQWQRMPAHIQEAVTVVSKVLPFRTNQYVMDKLIDWDNIPDDPMFRLTFPHADMLFPDEYAQLRDLLLRGDDAAVGAEVTRIRLRMNPHPAGQMTHNVPKLNGKPLGGLQHKYKETVLFFPAAGQTCHAYCTFCFRWPQFVGMEEFKFDAKETDELVAYLKQHREVTDVLITGGDPLIMKTSSLAGYLEPLLALDHIHNIRIGTKSVGYWPQRFVTDPDADDLLRLFEKVVRSGKSLALMAHYNHPIELDSEVARTAVRRILASGATMRTQSPLVRYINDDPRVWSELWTTCVRLGVIPYYMFIERDTGASHYFEIPLLRAYEIFQAAYRTVPGLARTVRGPSMSAFPGKVVIDGVATFGGEQVFVLQLLQARDPAWVRRPFFAKFDPQATWFDQLVPAFGEKRFFFQSDSAPAAPAAHVLMHWPRAGAVETAFAREAANDERAPRTMA